MFREDVRFLGLLLVVSVSVFGIGMLIGIEVAKIKIGNQYEVLFKE